jgi:hypothetical protein
MTKLYSNKIDNDKFYTKNSTAKICIDIIDFSIYDFVIEPSAGNGSFLSQIPHANKIGIIFHVGSQCMHKISFTKAIKEVGNIIKKTKIV